MTAFPESMNEQEKRRRTPPEGGGVDFFHASDGWRLRYAYWQTDKALNKASNKASNKAPKGTIFVLPGRTEFIEKYFEVAADLLDRSYNVFVIDWRGQGLSGRLIKDEPEKNHLTDFSLLGADLKELLAMAGRKRFPKPWFVLGHSTGALCFMEYVADNPGGDAKFEKAVFTAPLFAIRFQPLGETAVRGLVQKALDGGKEGSFALSQGKYGWKSKSFLTRDRLTSDKKRFANTEWFFDENPALVIGGVTNGWLAAAIKATDMVQTSGLAGKIKIPMLFILAGREKVVDNSSSQEFIARISTASLVTLQDARHEIMMERDETRATFWKLFDNFIA